MKPYFIKVGYFLIFIFAILNFLGLKQTEFDVQDKETGYIPFVSTVNNRNIKILATSVEALQGFFQG